MPEPDQTQSADRFLALIQRSRRGRFKLYLGMSAGVGKTYRMLQEAHQLIRSGIDLKIGFVETHNRTETLALVGDLPVIPRKKVFYKGKALEEMDLQAILNVHPEVVLVDELAHTNIAGSKNEKRWQDVVEMLEAGISVISALNIQHLESINGQVVSITGIEVTERVPDHVLRLADDIVNIDLPADELIARLKAGKIYHGTQIEAALQNFFRPEQILQLRELALKEAAYQVEKKIENEVMGPNRLRPEKLLACISTNDQGARKIIRQTARLASYYDAQWYVLYVQIPRENPDKINLASQRHLINNFKMATQLGAEVIRVKSRSISDTILKVAQEKQISFIILGKPRFNWWNFVFRSTLLRNMLLKTEGTSIDLIVVS